MSDKYYAVAILFVIWLIFALVDAIIDAIKKRRALKAEFKRFRAEKASILAENDNLSKKLNEANALVKELSEKCTLLSVDADKFECLYVEAEKKAQRMESENLSLHALFQKGNVNAIPWAAGLIADYLTYGIEIEAKKLDWGSNIQRQKKVASIRQIRAEAQRQIEAAKVAQYQLEYLRQLYPAIDDILEIEYAELEATEEIPDYDPIRNYLSKEEWLSLSETQRNQLALDRYIQSHRKSKWQIGRDYELAVAYEYQQKGYAVDTTGSYMGLEDLGRDLIAKKDGLKLIIQCKYWSKNKTIHEKHIYQLYGTMVSFCIENNLRMDSVKGVFVTNIHLSPMAKSAAEMLDLTVVENHPLKDFPRIKCNIGHDEYGCAAKIYHLPMDEQYDSTKIDKHGEFYAFTVAEAEAKGFRRAYKYFK